MDLERLKKEDISTLNKTLIDLLKQHFELRMQHKSTQLTDTSKLGKTKRSIAQVKTIMKEKQI